MTIVVATEVQGNLTLFGDLLLSGPAEIAPSSGTVLPTIGTTEKLLFPRGGPLITGLARKIHLIADRFAIGISGPVLRARRLVEDMREAASKLCDLDALRAFFESYDKRVLANLGIVGAFTIVRGDRYAPFLFGFGDGVLRTVTPTFGESFFGGSGAAELARLVTEGAVECGVRLGSPAPIAEAVAKSLSLVASNVAIETTFGTNLAEYWGGGYEVYVYADQRFQPVDGITFLTWHAELREDHLFLRPPHRILKTTHRGDALVIWAQEFDEETTRIVSSEEVPAPCFCREASTNVHVVTEFGENVPFDAESLGKPDFNSTFICSAIALEIPGKRSEVLSHVCISREFNHIRFEDSDTGGRLQFSGKMLQELMQALQSRMIAHGVKERVSPNA